MQKDILSELDGEIKLSDLIEQLEQIKSESGEDLVLSLKYEHAGYEEFSVLRISDKNEV